MVCEIEPPNRQTTKKVCKNISLPTNKKQPTAKIPTTRDYQLQQTANYKKRPTTKNYRLQKKTTNHKNLQTTIYNNYKKLQTATNCEVQKVQKTTK